MYIIYTANKNLMSHEKDVFKVNIGLDGCIYNRRVEYINKFKRIFKSTTEVLIDGESHYICV